MHDANTANPELHVDRADWRFTPDGDPRGYIQPDTLSELWFHTGTACNLECPFCLEGSRPGDKRIEQLPFDDAKPLIDEAIGLGVEQFSFTGGEPFVDRDFVSILDYALDHRPCMVLTNATKPLDKRLEQVAPLVDKPNALRFRISLDFPNPARHDAGRGEGNFYYALRTARKLHDLGFNVSIARLAEKNEDIALNNKRFAPFLREVGLPEDINFVVFPDFYPPGAHPEGVPHITENCMTTYHDEEARARFMCNFSKMVLKKDGRMRVYACTLVDDDPDYDLGPNLTESMRYRIMLKHHRCFSCFAHGASCSES